METPMQQPTVFGQMILDTYTILLLGFRIPNDVSQEEVKNKLDEAAIKVTNAIPFLGGQVVLEGRDKTHVGTYRTVSYEPHHGKSPVRVKDCSEICPSYDEIVQAKAPISMLDGEILSPAKGFPNEYDMISTMPVVIIQANFVKGGLLLCFASMHNALDMNGEGQLIRLFATAMRGEEFDKDHIRLGTCDPDDVVPYLRNGEKPLAHVEMRVPSRLGGGTQLAPPPAASPWTCFRFTREKLVKLKAEASKDLSVKFISTNDALCAFFWQRLSIARKSRLSSDTITVVRAINGRRVTKPPIPEAFMGQYVFITPATLPSETVMTASLSKLANALRVAVEKVDDYYVRSLATLVRDEDKSTFSYAATMKTGMDILTSSFADLRVLQIKFGQLGRADFARRPKLPEAENLSYLMPRTIDGDLDLVASLRVEDAENLEKDPVWKEYTEFIG